MRLIDALFAIEREINGASPQERLAVRQAQSAPIIAGLEVWLQETRAQLTRALGVNNSDEKQTSNIIPHSR